MDKENRRSILIKGEEYVLPHRIANNPPGEDKRPTFDEARKRLQHEIEDALNKVTQVPKEYLLDEFVVNLRMRVDRSAKSYHPTSFIDSSNAQELGSRKWIEASISKKDKNVIENKIGKEIFLKINKKDLERFKVQLEENENFSNGTIENIRSIKEIYFDNHNKLINNFNEEWKEGRVEIVLHPFTNGNEEVLKRLIELIDKFGGDSKKINAKTYDSGITFVSAMLNRECLEKILRFNPIRTAHPIFLRNLPAIRSGQESFLLPPPPQEDKSAKHILGVFDGGIDSSSPYLNRFAIEHNIISTPKDSDYLAHGTAVVGAALYGDIANYNVKTPLASPKIKVESFRVFPLSDPSDIDLYEIIDIIEDVVPKRKDIKVFNLSFGPEGAIDDDSISRFTYAIDKLSSSGERIFGIAVGNDGDVGDVSLQRIQSPSDAVNAIGVGAYSIDDDEKYVRAEYSSYGDGREGCKIKPDILEFGGDERRPFQVLPTIGNERQFSMGTSLATPLATAKLTEIVGECGGFATPLVGRALLVHEAQHPQNIADKYMGHGVLDKSVYEMLSCEVNRVTTIYQGKIAPSKVIKLTFPFLNDINYNGNVTLEWTIAIASEVQPKNTEDYTLMAIEDTFYPNSEKYTFIRDNGRKQTKSVDVRLNAELEEQLISEGWEKCTNPKTYSEYDNRYKPENERKKNFKWDTIIKRKSKFTYKSLYQPYLVLHAMERYECQADYINYAVIVTVHYHTYKEDAYVQTLKEYNKLQVSTIKIDNMLSVR